METAFTSILSISRLTPSKQLFFQAQKHLQYVSVLRDTFKKGILLQLLPKSLNVTRLVAFSDMSMLKCFHMRRVI